MAGARNLMLAATVAAIAVLAAVHGGILYYVWSHARLSLAVVSGVVLLMVIKHVGLLGPLFVLLRRWFRSDRS